MPCKIEALISIHALREEGDSTVPAAWSLETYFYPRPPRGGRRFGALFDALIVDFYPRPPRGGRHDGKTLFHANHKFLSTPSARRATHDGGEGCRGVVISIHALREEGDVVRLCHAAHRQHFYPRPPRGGRRRGGKKSSVAGTFLSTPSARRATAKTETKSLFSYKLYNILHEFRRALIYNGSKNDPNHAK